MWYGVLMQRTCFWQAHFPTVHRTWSWLTCVDAWLKARMRCRDFIIVATPSIATRRRAPARSPRRSAHCGEQQHRTLSRFRALHRAGPATARAWPARRPQHARIKRYAWHYYCARKNSACESEEVATVLSLICVGLGRAVRAAGRRTGRQPLQGLRCPTAAAVSFLIHADRPVGPRTMRWPICTWQRADLAERANLENTRFWTLSARILTFVHFIELARDFFVF